MKTKITVSTMIQNEKAVWEAWEKGTAFATATAADHALAGGFFVRKAKADGWPNAQIVCPLPDGKEIVFQ